MVQRMILPALKSDDLSFILGTSHGRKKGLTPTSSPMIYTHTHTHIDVHRHTYLISAWINVILRCCEDMIKIIAKAK